MSSQSSESIHPLDPLGSDEITSASRILFESGRISENAHFCWMALHEPSKQALAGFSAGAPVDRQARVMLFDRDRDGSFDAVVSLGEEKVLYCERVSEGQVALSFVDMIRVIQLVKANPDWQAAIRKRGIEDLDSVQVDPWVTGGFEPNDRKGARMLRALAYRRDFKADNGYAHPIEGVIALVDLSADEVVSVEDHGITPFPPEHGNYDAEHVGGFREDLKPLEIAQPDGPSFEVEGNEIRWQKWRFRTSLHPIHGLVLHTVHYRDAGRDRKILHRAALAEMVVPYGDPSPMHYWKSVFDAGEMGIGQFTNSLVLGCDCLGEIHYFDVTLCGSTGEPRTIAKGICLHEEDYGILWKHTDLAAGSAEVRRSRRLVVSAIHTVGNYDYGFFWYFYQDGTLQMEVKLTGILQTSAVEPGEEPPCAPLVAPQLAAPVHQHLFNFRLDFDLDGENNSVYQIDTELLPRSENPAGNAFAARATLLAAESEARCDVEPATNRYWKVVNPDVKNAMEQPVGYKLVPGNAPRLLADPESKVAKRAAFATHNLWVTAFDPSELSAAGDYPNQHPGGDGLPRYMAADRPLENTDVVLWYSFGVTHIPIPEHWPVMPVEYAGFTLHPAGFFDRNPALDVAPSKSCQSRETSGTAASATMRNVGKR